ncbi:MAG: 23S rRNA (uracil(1939)-C(5))-methyltransferase RlmD [Butyrivibrio sp.]|nr:23S rRNA (uracil(1939)-C(5))-methyltransferase RlmD [Butyrivibrio sp.]
MKKGQIYTGTVVKLKFPNKGVVECGEGKAVVKDVIPGQRVSFLAQKKRGGCFEGRLDKVLERSELEDAADCCPHFGICGGCSYQSLSYGSQLAVKSAQVKELLDAVCADYEFEGIIGSPIWQEYRNKMEFSFGDEYKDGPLSLGMHKKGSFYDIAAVPQCRIIDGDFRKILTSVLDFFEKKGLPFYHKMRREGYLRHLLVRKAKKTGEIMVDLVTTTQTEYDLTEYADMLKALDLEGSIVSLLHTRNDSLSDTIRNDGTDILFGRDYIYEELLGLRFKITPFSFFQTNTLGAELLYGKVREYVGERKNKTVFDLYSGTGTIAQILAPAARHVTGIELVEEAVLAARENARANGLDNCEFIAGDVLKTVGALSEAPDIIVLDPPRDGIHPKAIGPIMDFGADCIVYVSCKPTSLARDIEIFEARGYKVKRACCVDMFPATGGVEAVCLLGRRKPDDTIKVSVNMDDYYQIRDAEEAEKNPS